MKRTFLRIHGRHRPGVSGPSLGRSVEDPDSILKELQVESATLATALLQSMGKLWENYRKMGKSQENYGKTIGQWENP